MPRRGGLGVDSEVLLGNDDDPSEKIPLIHVTHGGGDPAERERPGDDRRELPRLDELLQGCYGDDVLELREINEPVTGDDEVLVWVRGASMHVDVWHERRTDASGRTSADWALPGRENDPTAPPGVIWALVRRPTAHRTGAGLTARRLS
jgi:hypothetical protein